MNEKYKPALAAITVIACLGFLAFLVHEKVDGSYVAALSSVAVIIAWVTRTPGSNDKGPGAAVVIAGIGTIIASLSGCASGMMKDYDDINNPSDDKTLSECRIKARVEKQMTNDPERAWQHYLACTADGGLR